MKERENPGAARVKPDSFSGSLDNASTACILSGNSSKTMLDSAAGGTGATPRMPHPPHALRTPFARPRTPSARPPHALRTPFARPRTPSARRPHAFRTPSARCPHGSPYRSAHPCRRGQEDGGAWRRGGLRGGAGQRQVWCPREDGGLRGASSVRRSRHGGHQMGAGQGKEQGRRSVSERPGPLRARRQARLRAA